LEKTGNKHEKQVPARAVAMREGVRNPLEDLA
jgi:hypothetical protein